MPMIQGDIFLNAERSYDLLRKAIQVFEEYLQKKLPPKAPEYYQARNFLKEGQAFYDDILRKAKLLLGPIPPYSSRDFEEQRALSLIENRVIVRGQSLEALRQELAGDECIKKLMTEDEIEAYLATHFQSQSRGKRKLANIKVRMILDVLGGLAARGNKLRVEAQKYFQSGAA